MEHSSPNARGNLSPRISKDQCKDTGMALVLILLLLAVLLKREGHVNSVYLVAAIVIHIVNMIVPRIYHWPAVVWFRFSHLLGIIMSKVILTFVFALVVTPLAVIRRMMGRDPMQLKAFKAGTASAMVERNHTFTATDISRPY